MGYKELKEELDKGIEQVSIARGLLYEVLQSYHRLDKKLNKIFPQETEEKKMSQNVKKG